MFKISNRNSRIRCEICSKLTVKTQTSNFIKKEAPSQVFSCEFSEISKITFFHRAPRVAASE